MKRASFCAAAIAALALHSFPALAAVTVSPSSVSGFTITVSGADVTIIGPGLTGSSGRAFTISTTSVNDAIGAVTVKNTGASNTSIQVDVTGLEGFALSLHSFIRDAASTGEVWLNTATVAGNIGTFNGTARDGDIIVNRIGSLVTNRNLYADITTLGSAISSERDIGSLTVTALSAEYYSDGQLSANIWATSDFATCGGIGTIDVEGGIGAIDGGAMDIECLGDIETIISGGLSVVDISVPSNKEVWSLVTRTGGWGGDGTITYGIPISVQPPPTPGSPLTQPGTITCGRLRNFSVKKDMQGDITCALAPFSSNTWKIGKSLTSSASISLPANGLTHQIIVNEQNVTGTWTPNILVDSTPIGEGYANLPNTLGLGSAGLATFTLHPEACAPPDGGTVYVGSLVTPWLGEGDPPCVAHYGVVRLHHYGEVDLLDGTESTNAYTVMISAAGSDDEPVEDTSGYTAREASDVASRGRDILLFPTSGSGWVLNRRYTVTLVANELRSANVQGLPSVAPYSITFTLIDACKEMFDMNMSGGVEGGDIEAWIVSPADFNLDTIANGVDLGSMLRWIAEHPE